ncbi:MAG: hypothetical protein VR68_01460 [Peptococcaceae bacterium BRH_c4a]|nr:MAG: hypothetical protein VR68_01460 [Peptococcaceae bacterium BRH_c4a]
MRNTRRKWRFTGNEIKCIYCYENGGFRQPDVTMEQMIEICVPHMKESGMSEENARELLDKHLPMLKRWRAKGA